MLEPPSENQDERFVVDVFLFGGKVKVYLQVLFVYMLLMI